MKIEGNMIHLQIDLTGPSHVRLREYYRLDAKGVVTSD